MLPFSLPHRSANEERYVLDAMRSGALHGDGLYARQAVRKLRDISGLAAVLLTSSASSALDMIFWSLPPGAEVIIPAYTFPSAANAVLRGRGKVVLCDVEPGTLNLDPNKAAAKKTAATYAICVTHYAGIACDLEALASMVQDYKLLLVEDAAQALGATHKGRALGGIGHFGCYSFHGTKNITCGEGGAYLQQIADEDILERACFCRDKGTNRRRFLLGEVPFYSWETAGSNFFLSEMASAMLLAQLEEFEKITMCRKAICAAYTERLAPLFARERLLPMHVPGYAEGNGHAFHIRVASLEERLEVQAKMAAKGVPCLPHYVPLHLGSLGRRLGYAPGDFPCSERAWETLLRLPVFTSLDERSIDMVCEVLREALP